MASLMGQMFLRRYRMPNGQISNLPRVCAQSRVQRPDVLPRQGLPATCFLHLAGLQRYHADTNTI